MKALDLGNMEYGRAWDCQHLLHSRVCSNPEEAFLLRVEHPSVLTLGKNATRENLLATRAQYEQLGIALFEVDRGGEVTAHNPGQLVIYPIMSMRRFGLTPKRYVGLLEAVVIEVLESFGLPGQADPSYPGVWVGGEKICAVGVRIKNRVSMHGIALNVCNDLTLFDKIVPCGISGRRVTSFAQLGCVAGTRAVFDRFVEVWQSRICPVEFYSNIRDLIGA